MKIAYIELDTHGEIAAAFYELMSQSERIQVDYYFSKKILKALNLKPGGNIFAAAPETLLSQLSCYDYQLVIIGTAHRYFSIFNDIRRAFRTAVVVHNVNFSRRGRFQLLRCVLKKDQVYRLKLLMKEGLLQAPDFYQSVAQKFVLDSNLVSDKLEYLPLFFTKFSKKVDNERINVVIPGAVSQYRRDYRRLFNMIEKEKELNDFQFVFLGKAAGEELNTLKKLAAMGKPVHYFSDRVPQEVFAKSMKSADVLWCPVQQFTEFFSIEEIYGSTKMSGNIGDAIRYGKVAVFPNYYKSKQPFIQCEESDVFAQFKKIKGSQTIDFGNFSAEKNLTQLEEQLISAIKN